MSKQKIQVQVTFDQEKLTKFKSDVIERVKYPPISYNPKLNDTVVSI